MWNESVKNSQRKQQHQLWQSYNRRSAEQKPLQRIFNMWRNCSQSGCYNFRVGARHAELVNRNWQTYITALFLERPTPMVRKRPSPHPIPFKASRARAPRGPRVYPYPTRTRGYGSGTGMSYGSGRVRVRSPRVRVYPFLPVKNTIFHDVGAISNIFISSLLCQS